MVALLWTFVAVALLLLLALALFVAARWHRKQSTVKLDLVGRTGSVTTRLAPEGAVLVDGELWPALARSGVPVPEGQNVRVVGARGHLLEVEPVS